MENVKSNMFCEILNPAIESGHEYPNELKTLSLPTPIWLLLTPHIPEAMDTIGEPPMIDHYAAPWVAKEKYELRKDARR